jgi:hypothetical protein
MPTALSAAHDVLRVHAFRAQRAQRGVADRVTG